MAEKKGKPTPKRKVSEAKLKVSSLSPAASKEAKRALKEQARIRRLEARAAYMRGEESALPYRDKGPARRFVRNYIDERRSFAEYFLVLIVFILFLTLIPIPTVQLAAVAIMYSAMVVITIDGIVLSRRLKKLVSEKYPDEPTNLLNLEDYVLRPHR
jgi:ABC-type bacteriocin/lantibiotic exporter with double-glycine peptidase domain